MRVFSQCQIQVDKIMSEKGIYSLSVLVCPLDGLALHYVNEGVSSSFRCAKGHTFDRAREGYVNLLSVQDKRSRDPGDTKEMIAARGRILSSGMYLPLADAVSQKVNAELQSLTLKAGAAFQQEFTLLDAGCGEGYYLDQCMQTCATKYPINAIGMDISKWAIIAAAKRNKNSVWLVASNRNPPVANHSIDIILCAFGFPDFAAFKKILKPGGCVILLDPGQKHLLELREIIYPIIKPYKNNDFSKAAETGFSVAMRERLTYPLSGLCQQQIQDVLLMSPHLYRAQAAGKEKARALQELNVTVDVNLTILTL
jgi:23S rRNA (guanine745-N1)-methyltransferase